MRKYSDPRLIGLEQLYREGEAADAADPRIYEREVATGRGEDVAILCTTSGTTARPKLAMLQSGPSSGTRSPICIGTRSGCPTTTSRCCRCHG